MKRLMVLSSLAIGFAWGGISVWLVGYNAGYEDGASNAWDTARENLMPTKYDPLDYNVADYPGFKPR